MPAAVEAASQAYREESDVIGRFFDDCCTLKPHMRTQASTLYGSFRDWCERNGEKGYAANKFGALIRKEKQLEKTRTRIDKKSCYVWKGIGLLAQLEGDENDTHNSTIYTSDPLISEAFGIPME